MAKEIQILTQFIEGNLSPKEFEEQLFTNPILETFLSAAVINWKGTYLEGTTVFLYLAEQDYNSSTGILNAQGTIELFLKKAGIEANPSNKYAEEYNLISMLSPKYIDADSEFIEKYILPSDKTLSKSEQKQLIKNRYSELFKFQSKPPKWIQNPQWPIKNDKPLFFLAQVDIKDCEFFHDNGSIYLFLDTQTKTIETIQQFY
ncbi:hypothetical protein [Chryseobacterium sp. ERMR1:04]|uniref:hypothetical protein n=1 Tax=Chryseobacterium sp. ERMR1:04 TaxID=1705393 RepID=UPI0006C8983F|nr:hypothetical protein [Chryseobacterium sp. ERMR1:04]KPH12425.1 hypothetical protein AMQ68_16060 [Chryseobacterium sp. ERMR1:04]